MMFGLLLRLREDPSLGLPETNDGDTVVDPFRGAEPAPRVRHTSPIKLQKRRIQPDGEGALLHEGLRDNLIVLGKGREAGEVDLCFFLEITQ
jgi:hypothetical protein